MKKVLFTAAFAFVAFITQAQVSFSVQPDKEKEKTFGPAVEKTIIDTKSGDSVVLRVEVMLKKPIPMGCQYIYRITNLSADKTAKISSIKYAGQFQMKKEKMKPGEVVEFLVNTMSRCDGKGGFEKCVNCNPDLTITDVEIK